MDCLFASAFGRRSIAQAINEQCDDFPRVDGFLVVGDSAEIGDGVPELCGIDAGTHGFCGDGVVQQAGVEETGQRTVGRVAGVEGSGEAIHESLAVEVKPFGINVTIVEPGAYATEFGSGSMGKLTSGMDAYADLRAHMVERMQAMERGDPRATPEAVSEAGLLREMYVLLLRFPPRGFRGRSGRWEGTGRWRRADPF